MALFNAFKSSLSTTRLFSCPLSLFNVVTSSQLEIEKDTSDEGRSRSSKRETENDKATEKERKKEDGVTLLLG